MKKVIALTLALIMALALVACSGSGEDVGGRLEPAPTTTAPQQTTPAPDATTQAGEFATEATTEATTAATEAATTPENAVSMGRMEGGVYTNTYAGFACTLDENWSFLGAAELQDLPDNVAELLEGTQIGDSLDALTQFTDMMAENLDALCTINVLYQKHTAQQRLAYAMLSEDQIMDETLKQSEAMKAAYAQMGIEVSAMEKKTVTFLNQERVALHTTSTLNGVPYYTLQLFDFQKGAYGVTLTLASFQEDNTEALLELFYAVE